MRRDREQKRHFRELAVEFVLAVMSSVPSGTIDPFKHWLRAKSALIEAMDYTTWDEILQHMCDSLQIVVPTHASGHEVFDVEARLDAMGPRALIDWRNHVRQVPTAVIARAAARREEERKEEERTGLSAHEVRRARRAADGSGMQLDVL